jgi:hypothetical protein
LSVVNIVRYRSLRRASHSSRAVLPNVVRRWVWSRNLVNEEAIAHWGLLRQKKKKKKKIATEECPSTRIKTRPTATLFTRHPTSTDLGLNTGLRRDRLRATNHVKSLNGQPCLQAD